MAAQEWGLGSVSDWFSLKKHKYWFVVTQENCADVRPTCQSRFIWGNWRTIDGDQIVLDAHNIQTSDCDTLIRSGTSIVYENSSTPVTVNVDDKAYMHVYKSEQAKERSETAKAFGGILILTGIVTAANAFIAPKGDGRTGILISSGVQFSLGSLLYALVDDERHHFKNNREIWGFEYR